MRLRQDSLLFRHIFFVHNQIADELLLERGGGVVNDINRGRGTELVEVLVDYARPTL